MTRPIPEPLQRALRPITVICGHYGVGKTNLAVNLAIDSAAEGVPTTLIDLDIVNPYFRASEQRALLEMHGIELISPVFAEAGSNLDVPSLTGAIEPKLADATADELVIVDLGGDDVGAGALGRFSGTVQARDHAMLYVFNRHRNLVHDPREAHGILQEIEAVTRLHATALVDNSHLKQLTDAAALDDGAGYARTLCDLCGLELAAKTCPEHLSGDPQVIEAFDDPSLLYTVAMYVKSPWE
ncbi:MAG: ParA family protein [Actinomycetota bacterium]|nr:ParA family protein [Actinomycetota bacterium]